MKRKEIVIQRYLSPLGEMLLASDGESLTGVWFAGQKYFLAGQQEEDLKTADLAIFKKATDWLAAYFAKERPNLNDLKLAPQGTAFQLRVWQILLEIPYGELTTYGRIAKRLAAESGQNSMSSQAVGGAVGRNPISLLIPCHRVVGKTGNLTGYAGGLERKKQLLLLEGQHFDGERRLLD